MNILSFFLLTIISLGVNPIWLNDFEQAKNEAQKENKHILVNFSGSDWCVPCIKMKKEIFESDVFKNYAAENLVLINANFPRLKKNKLDKKQIKKNEELAEKYNKNGIFPLTILLDAEGNVIKKWEGLPKQSAEEFTTDIRMMIDAPK